MRDYSLLRSPRVGCSRSVPHCGCCYDTDDRGGAGYDECGRRPIADRPRRRRRTTSWPSLQGWHAVVAQMLSQLTVDVANTSDTADTRQNSTGLRFEDIAAEGDAAVASGDLNRPWMRGYAAEF